MTYARQLFDQIPDPNIALWNSMFRGYAQSESYREVVFLFFQMKVAWTSMINGYILSADLVSARRLFDLAPERDVVLWNIMVSGYIEGGDMGYATNGNVEALEGLFEEMPERNIFSWNALIGGVSACARLGALDLGKWVHVYAESSGLKGNVYVGNALMDMYAKCGIIENAISVFRGMDTKDLISWNTLIGGLAMHSRGADALNLFFQMKNAGQKPDGITFIGILCACTHMGLVEDGFAYFQSMADDYLIMPQIEHYGCMVDMLARAGRLEQAMAFVRKMPVEADGVIWAGLLGACRIYKNVELAELALQRLIELEPKNPANYVMLSNIYGDAGRWEDVARLKVAMRDTGFKKLPGCSLIEVNDAVVEFYSLDERHPQIEEIYGVLRGLVKVLRSFGYVPDLTGAGRGT
ncbi:Pentatricopeptide repeat-containing protein, chloroplastic [Vitis vinifera]|uniref:Pentatricopeptide repeat-containing protein, chloroplastic n=1 Tax=Vitis vinifera TaxID=29760 RepID=A0A438JDV6_VITVI|nr:Pentatricopeptide repeat-containing protein, chloroplastic [Vitis vinifera]